MGSIPTISGDGVKFNTGDVVVIQRGVRITLEWIGEGLSGDYDPQDVEDKPLMRFSIDRKVGRRWEAVDDASYCTQIPAGIPKARKIILAQKILDAMCDALQAQGTHSLRKISRGLSWMDGEG